MTSHREWFDPAVAEAEVEDFTWHGNRRTFASRLAMAGVDLRTIADLLGHSTIQIVHALCPPQSGSQPGGSIAARWFRNRGDTKADTN